MELIEIIIQTIIDYIINKKNYWIYYIVFLLGVMGLIILLAILDFMVSFPIAPEFKIIFFILLL